MSRERWGTFSVMDHLQPQAFVTDVLLYDRLVIPFPAGDFERSKWFENNWQPDLLDKKLDLLGDLAIPVEWDKAKHDFFKSVFHTSKAINFDATIHLAGIRSNDDLEVNKQNPFELTKYLLRKKYLPDLPKGVSKVWAISAFTSYEGYKNDVEAAKNDLKLQNERHLSMVISHKFLVPDDHSKSDTDLLKIAIGLSKRDDFKEKRAALYKWQQTIIEEDITDAKAIEELEEYLNQYNKIIEKAAVGTKWKFGFLVLNLLGAGAGLATGHVETFPVIGLGLTGLASVTQYLKFDNKPDITKDCSYAAAMIHDVQKEFDWK